MCKQTHSIVQLKHNSKKTQKIEISLISSKKCGYKKVHWLLHERCYHTREWEEEIKTKDRRAMRSERSDWAAAVKVAEAEFILNILRGHLKWKSHLKMISCDNLILAATHFTLLDLFACPRLTGKLTVYFIPEHRSQHPKGVRRADAKKQHKNLIQQS